MSSIGASASSAAFAPESFRFCFCRKFVFYFFLDPPLRRRQPLTSTFFFFSISLSPSTQTSAFLSLLFIHVQAYDRVPNPAARAAGAKFVDSPDDLLRQSDILSLHVPLNASTKHLINAESLKKLKPGAMIINVSRGGE